MREAKAIGGEDCALAIVADVTDPDAVEQAVRRTIVEFGSLHILVNNAGTNPRAAGLAPVGRDHLTNFWQISLEGWNRAVAVNLSGPFLMARAVMEHMLAQRWGRIIDPAGDDPGRSH